MTFATTPTTLPHWAQRDDENVKHMGLIGVGGYGEIHKVCISVSCLYSRKMQNLDNHQVTLEFSFPLMIQVFARKLVRPFAERINDADIANEIRAMEKLCKGRHQNIIIIFNHGRLRVQSAFYFIDMQLCDFNLDEYLRGTKHTPGLNRWKRAETTDAAILIIWPIMDQITDGLAFIHKHKEVHRDLNPQNGTESMASS